MGEAIRSGDVVEVEPIKIAQLTRGEIVLFERQGRLVAHRLLAVLDEPGRGPRLIVRGDNLPVCDRPVPAYAVLGRVTRVRRGLYAFLRGWGSEMVHGLLRAALPPPLCLLEGRDGAN